MAVKCLGELSVSSNYCTQKISAFSGPECWRGVKVTFYFRKKSRTFGSEIICKCTEKKIVSVAIYIVSKHWGVFLNHFLTKYFRKKYFPSSIWFARELLPVNSRKRNLKNFGTNIPGHIFLGHFCQELTKKNVLGRITCKFSSA